MFVGDRFEKTDRFLPLHPALPSITTATSASAPLVPPMRQRVPCE